MQGKGLRSLHLAKLTMCGDLGGPVMADDDGWKLLFLRCQTTLWVGIHRLRGEATSSTSGVGADSLSGG